MPRFSALAVGCVAIGAAVAVAPFFSTLSLGGNIASHTLGLVGVALGLLYLRSPLWRTVIRWEGDRLLVQRGDATLLRLSPRDVVELRVAVDGNSCFVWSGQGATSLLVPGPGAPASYAISRKKELISRLRQWLPREKCRELRSLRDASATVEPKAPGTNLDDAS